jgi:hypothetical protein
LYIGELVWNRLRYVKDPETGKRVSRLNPSSEWIVKDVPALHIVPPDLWNAVKARQLETRHALAGGTPLVRARRPTYLFTGLTKCGCCGSGFTMASSSRLACAGARNRGTCENHLTIRRDEVEARVLKAMEHRLWNEELFMEFCTEFTREAKSPARRSGSRSHSRDPGAGGHRRSVEATHGLGRDRRMAYEPET